MSAKPRVQDRFSASALCESVLAKAATPKPRRRLRPSREGGYAQAAKQYFAVIGITVSARVRRRARLSRARRG